MNDKLKTIKQSVFLVSITFFILSLTQVALTYNDFDGLKEHNSIALLLAGGLAILGGGLAEWLVWLANPLYFIGIIFLIRSNKKSKYISSAATALALSFMTWREILAAENGRTATIEILNLGYWLWLMSMIALTIGTFYYFGVQKKLNELRNKE